MDCSHHYASDVSDKQWQLIKNQLPKRSKVGRPGNDRREIVNAILYVVRTGCQWRMIPKEFPNWSTVYWNFWRWSRDGTWEKVHRSLREKTRKASGKKATPTTAIVDSQSVRTAEGGEERGFDAGKKVTGRKRHIAVDTLGLVLAISVHGADWQDYDGACLVMTRLKKGFRRLKVIFADSAYAKNDLPTWIKNTFGWIVQTILRPIGAKGFVVLPKRWIVERTFAWIGRYRRTSKDYEKTIKSSEAMIHLAMINLMSRRLARK